MVENIILTNKEKQRLNRLLEINNCEFFIEKYGMSCKQYCIEIILGERTQVIT